MPLVGEGRGPDPEPGTPGGTGAQTGLGKQSQQEERQSMKHLIHFLVTHGLIRPGL